MLVVVMLFSILFLVVDISVGVDVKDLKHNVPQKGEKVFLFKQSIEISDSTPYHVSLCYANQFG